MTKERALEKAAGVDAERRKRSLSKPDVGEIEGGRGKLGLGGRCPRGSPGRVESGRGKKTRRAISCLNHDKLITALG